MANRPVALVTGGARRIGRAIVEDLARHGFDIGLHFHGSRPDAEETAKLATEGGAKVHLFECDLSLPGAANVLFGDVLKQFEGVDLLVNNASVFEDDTILDFSETGFDRHIAIHVKAPSLLAQAFAAQNQTEGLIVNIIDQRVWNLTPNFYSYTLSKAALWTATQTMARALAPRIRVNAIGPGPTLRNSRQSEADFAKQLDGLILKRGPELTEFGATIRYLWSAKSVTGQMIALDGGQHLAWETPDIAGIVE
jgi:NAD(P)-dependent dehydrogenase (short-subunit alcohol dehydrogenase family)